MKLVIELDLSLQPSAEEISSALYLLSANIDNQFLEDLQYWSWTSTMQQLPIVVSVCEQQRGEEQWVES